LFTATPRSDAPVTLVSPTPKAQAAFDAVHAAPDDVMSEMALHWRRATAGLPGAPSAVVTPTTQDEVHRFLRSTVQAFLDHRAGTPG